MPSNNRIRELIAARDETFGIAAARAGITEKTLRSAANGRPIHRGTRRLIALAFGVEEAEIFSSGSTTAIEKVLL